MGLAGNARGEPLGNVEEVECAREASVRATGDEDAYRRVWLNGAHFGSVEESLERGSLAEGEFDLESEFFDARRK